jgi:hypothetical protein
VATYLLQVMLVLGMVAILLGAVEIGYRRGMRAGPDEHVLSHATAWEGGLLGLLALLLGFTFAMAVTRFDNRRDLIPEEANAIESVGLRAHCLDRPSRDEVQALLPSYLDARIRSYATGISLRQTELAYQQGKALQHQLWNVVVSGTRAHPDSESVAAFVESADELVKAENRRHAALYNHVPLPVFAVLLVVAAAGMAVTGYSCGLHRRRLPLGMILLPMLIALVVALVFDLDYPRAGAIRAGQRAMLRLRGSL